MTAECENASALARGVLKELYDRLDRVMNDEITKFSDKVNEFYASAQSRDADACAHFLSGSIDDRNARCDLTMRTYLHSHSAFTQACYQHAREYFKSKEYWPASDCYARLRWAYAQTPELSADDGFWKETKGGYSALEQLETEWRKLIGSAVNRHWRPIRILSGDYGEYNDCIGYDEEFGEFLLFSPDDNYYHWNDYNVSQIPQEYAEEKTDMILSGLPAAPASPYYHSYFSATDIEIKTRIRRL